jgi:hypothetical protein
MLLSIKCGGDAIMKSEKVKDLEESSHNIFQDTISASAWRD